MTNLLAESANAKPIADDDLESWLHNLVVQIRANNYVVPGSTTVVQADDQFLVRCSLTYDRPSEIKRPLQTPEPIVLKFSREAVRHFDAPEVYSDRPDFPRTLPHLNPVSANSPVSFCLSEHGGQGLFEAGGIGAMIDATARWLHDAVADSLNAVGWEPHPSNAILPALFDAAWFQQTAYSTRTGQSTCATGRAMMTIFRKSSDLFKVELEPEEIGIPNAEWTEPKVNDPFVETIIPWVLLAGPRKMTITDYFSTEVKSWEELAGHATQVGCDEALEGTFKSVLEYSPEAVKHGLVLLLGVWRPKPLIERIPGLADGGARNLEIIPYIIRSESADLNKDTMLVERLRHYTATDSSLLRFIGRTADSDVRISVLGCGALGSKIACHLGREGVEGMTLIDYEILEPHNFGRHALFMDSILGNKATETAKKLNVVIPADRSCHVGTENNIVKMEVSELLNTFGSGPALIVDATASRQVLRKLVAVYADNQSFRTMRATINNDGRLGIALLEGADRNPRVDDLIASLYVSAMDNEDVSSWLVSSQSEDRNGVLLGLGCASLTTRMADHVVSAHASAMTGLIHRVRQNSHCRGGIGLMNLDEFGVARQTDWLPVDRFVQVESTRSPDWTVRFPESLLKEIRGFRHNELPKEAGGFLYGLWDDFECNVTVVFATHAQPELAAQGKLRLPAAGSTTIETKLLRKTKRMLQPVGTWHSHPGRSAEPSGTDMDTFQAMCRDNELTPRPAALLVVADEELAALVGPPAIGEQDDAKS